MNITLHKDFEKQFIKLNPSQQKKFRERRNIFLQEQFHPSLNNHALKGKYLGYRSINITGDLRAIYKKIGEDIMFIDIDSHSNLYG